MTPTCDYGGNLYRWADSCTGNLSYETTETCWTVWVSGGKTTTGETYTQVYGTSIIASQPLTGTSTDCAPNDTISVLPKKQTKPCSGDSIPNPEIVSSGASGKQGGTFGCTRIGTICEGESGKKKHDGLDIKANINSKTYAMYRGTVSGLINTFSPNEYREKSYGNYIILTVQIGGNTYFIRYNHLNTVSVTQGQVVNSGDIIGLNGNTGNANSKGVTPHIHIQVFDSSWNSIDPEPFLGTQFDDNFNPIPNPNC